MRKNIISFLVNNPYCLKRLRNGRWILLNRYYKPIGCNTREWIDYDNYSQATIIDGLTPEIIKTLSCQQARSDTDPIFLYEIFPRLMRSKRLMQVYRARLEIIERLRVAAQTGV